MKLYTLSEDKITDFINTINKLSIIDFNRADEVKVKVVDKKEESSEDDIDDIDDNEVLESEAKASYRAFSLEERPDKAINAMQMIAKQNINEMEKAGITGENDNFMRKDANYIRYQKALFSNDGDIKEEDYTDYLFKVDALQETINDIKRKNANNIRLTAMVMDNIFLDGIDKNASDQEKCKYLFEFVTRIFELHKQDFPISYDYSTVFYRNIPTSDDFCDLIVTSAGYYGNLAILMTELGRELGLNINVLNCKYNNELYSINEVIIDGKKTYIDTASFIEGRKAMSECLLVSRNELTKSNGSLNGVPGRYYTEEQIVVLSLGYREIREVGETLTIPNTVSYNIDEVIRKREEVFPKLVEYNKFDTKDEEDVKTK